MENKKSFREEVGEELGLLSAVFMSQECKGTEIIMPSEKLSEALDRICLYNQEAISLAVEKFQEVCWNPKNPMEHIWERSCKCDGCQKNNEVYDLISRLK